MIKLLPFLCLLVLCHSQDKKSDESLDKIIDDIFGNSTPGPKATEKPESTSEREDPKEEPDKSLDKIIDDIFGNSTPGPKATEKPESTSEREAVEDKICTTNQGKTGRCVPFYMCDPADDPWTKPWDVLVDGFYIRIPIDPTETICPSVLDACCEPKQINNIVTSSNDKDSAKPKA